MLKLTAPPSVQLFIEFFSSMVSTMEQLSPTVHIMGVRTAPSRVIFEWRINIEGEELGAAVNIMAGELDRLLKVYFSFCHRLSSGGFRLYSVALEPTRGLMRMEIMVDKEWRLLNLCEDVDLEKIHGVLNDTLPFLALGRKPK
jgi:hypothetical protein